MMTQSVKTQAVNLFGNAAGSVTSKGKQSGSGFDLMIGNNLKVLQSNNQIEKTDGKKLSSKNDNVSDAGKSDDADITEIKKEGIQKDSATDSTKKSHAKKTMSVKANTTDAAKKVEEDTTDVMVDEQLLAQITGMLQAIQEAVMDALNLSPEELNQLLNQQGMTITDLLQTENLQQLVLANNGQTNILAVLTDETLANQMNDLLQQVEGIISGADLGLTKEQIDALLIQADQKRPVETIAENLLSADVSKEISGEEKTAQQTNAVNTEKNSLKDESKSVNDNSNNEASDSVQVTGTKDNSSTAQEDTAGHDRKDLKADDQFQAFIDNMVKTTKDSEIDFPGNIAQATQLREIANQIIDRIKVTITADQSSMELQLNPENLGKVNLTVQSKNGIMTAQFVVQNEISKEAIESQMQTLRETLSGQGLKVEAIEVTVANYSFNPEGQENSQNQTASQKDHEGKKITLEEAINMTEEDQTENISEDVTGMRGSQIDYTA